MISRGYNELSFREDLKVLYNRLGIENRKILFVFSDQHVVEDGTYTVPSPYRHVLTLYSTLLVPTSSVTSVNIMTYFSWPTFVACLSILSLKLKKKLKPDKLFMGKPSQNYGVSPKYGVTQFYLQPDISEHIPP